MKGINGGSMDVRGEYWEGGEKRGVEGGAGGGDAYREMSRAPEGKEKR